MRWIICLLAVIGASPALAQDFAVLRGSEPIGPPRYANWSGPYVGGQIGESWYGVDFTHAAESSINTISGLDANFTDIPLSKFPRLSSFNMEHPIYGGFAGYNYQFEDAVIGLEIAFNKSNETGAVTDTESHNYFVNANNTLYDTTYNVTTTVSESINQYGELRARVGWAYHNFLPYAFGALTYAQIDTSNSVNVNYCGEESPYTCTNPPPDGSPPPPAPIGGNWTISNQNNGKWYPGFGFGGGIDYAVSRSLFVRGEVEYIQFGVPNGIRVSAADANIGAGVRF